MTMQDEMLKTIKSEFDRRVREEGLERIEKCLSLLSEEEAWRHPNENTVSIANLVLHLSGNVRQWICAGLGGESDVRKRDLEFSTTGGIPKSELVKIVRLAVQDAQQVISKTKVEELMELKDVQVYKENGLSILIHVIEHFSYHVGQITYATKSMKNLDTLYYPEDLG